MRLPRPFPLVVVAVLPLAPAAAQPATQPPPSARPRQDPSTDHEGFWISFGAGTGRQSIDCAPCTPAPVPQRWRSGRSGGVYLAMGGTPRANLLLGGELAVNFNGVESDESASVGHVGVVAQLYPARGRGLFVRLGGGIGIVALVDSARGFPEEDELTSVGLALRTGIGYDFRFGGRFGIAPYADFVQTLSSGTRGTTRAGEAYRGPRNPAVLQAGLSFNWY